MGVALSHAGPEGPLGRLPPEGLRRSAERISVAAAVAWLTLSRRPLRGAPPRCEARVVIAPSSRRRSGRSEAE